MCQDMTAAALHDSCDAAAAAAAANDASCQACSTQRHPITGCNALLLDTTLHLLPLLLPLLQLNNMPEQR
jgi:hypothetical protein